MPFSQAPAGARWILGGWRRLGWLSCCGRSCWWCSQFMTKRSSPAGSGRGGGGAVREGYKVVALLLKPSLGLLELVGAAPTPAAIPRVCHRPPDCTRGSSHSSAYPGILWCWLSSRFPRREVACCGPHLKPHQRP